MSKPEGDLETIEALKDMAITILKERSQLQEDRVTFEQEKYELEKKRQDIANKEFENIAKETALEFREQKLKEEQERFKNRRMDYFRSIVNKGLAFSILKELPPSMNEKGKNESYPIVRFAWKTNIVWYQNFIQHYGAVCNILRTIHSQEGLPADQKIQIVAVFHYKNFPAKNYKELREHVGKLLRLLTEIKNFFEAPNAQLLSHMEWFENLEYPPDPDQDPSGEAMRQAQEYNEEEQAT